MTAHGMQQSMRRPLVNENSSSISRVGMVSSLFSVDSCCSLLVMARILTKVTSSGASGPAGLPTLAEELLVPAQSKRPRSRFATKKNVWRAVIEVGFIIFLFYSNLLMGEFERSGMGQKKGVAWAIGDVFTVANFEIATIAALLGYILFEFLRDRS
jgi:hypothetical protein